MNINLITSARLERVEGEKGNFHVSLTQHPRFIDPAKCTSCGDCIEVCPVSLPSEYELGMTKRKAVYKRYAQAIPSSFAISKSGTAPCRAACPAHISVQGYIALIAQGRFMDALRLIKEENPLPAVCGRVCHHPCESVCTRGKLDQPVAINFLKRYVADLDLNSAQIYLPDVSEPNGHRVAIIGSGPAGLSCAYFLKKRGYETTIFEKLPIPGGMLTFGIPDYRLPRNIIDAEIRIITNMGVKIETGVDVGKDLSIRRLRDKGYEAIFLGIGSQACKNLNIEGEDLKGVFSGVEFLRHINLGEKPFLGDRVAVVGGGNVAMDAVRSARRTGSGNAFIIYRRGLEEMPANQEEIEECNEEGIEIHTLTNPVRFIGEAGRVKAVKCVKMELGEPDSSGRRRPVPVEGSEFTIEVDSVIQAIGQEADWSCLGPECACNLTEWGTLKVDKITLQSDDPDIFAGGDAVTGPATVVEAIEAGKQAAISIDRYIHGQNLFEGRDKLWDPAKDIDLDVHRIKKRVAMPRLDPFERVENFKEVQLGLSEEQAHAEAERCISCGICSECFQCVEACKAGAVTLETHSQLPRSIELDVGALILAPGSDVFDPLKLSAYSYGKSRDIMTSLEFERILSASGPTMGHLIRPSDSKEPDKIAWIQCVGSRDSHALANGFCSSVCCMYAMKQAVIAREHAGKHLECTIFFMDMRTHGKDFEKYYEEARERHKIRFIRSRAPAVEVLDKSRQITVSYTGEDERAAQEDFDMVILSVGLETSSETLDLAKRLDIDLTEGKFCKTGAFHPVSTSADGIYACGTFCGPKDIPQSVIEAGSAAAEASALLMEARGTLTRGKRPPVERQVGGQRPRIGVFVCQCGINIGGVVDVPKVREYAKALPFVEYVTDNLYTCSQDTQETMAREISENALNRIVVAACTPKTHEALFQDTLIEAGLNRYLFEMANIRNQDSWVHRDDPEAATEKAKDLVRMAVSKVALLEPLEETKIRINKDVLIVGGGVAGMAAARNLSSQGYSVNIVERLPQLGGQARGLLTTWQGEDIRQGLEGMISQVESDRNIRIHLESTISKVEGFVGNFTTTLEKKGGLETIDHGVAILATGAEETRPSEYLYGEDHRVMTHLEFDRMIISQDSTIGNLKTMAFIQCVGSREPARPYCSRVCCTHSIKTALKLKEINPDMDIFIFFRDIRTYGEREYLYREARLKGIIFIPYTLAAKPRVFKGPDSLRIEFFDQILKEGISLDADILCLASAIAPRGNEKIARFFKAPLNEDGFFIERHAKLGPSECATDGVFLCGMCHYPKSIDESVAHALSAASRAGSLLAKDSIMASGIVAEVDAVRCSGCGVCADICPYSAPALIENGHLEGTAEINPVLCKGCGLCVSSCRSGAVRLKGFDQCQIMSMINQA